MAKTEQRAKKMQDWDKLFSDWTHSLSLPFFLALFQVFFCFFLISRFVLTFSVFLSSYLWVQTYSFFLFLLEHIFRLHLVFFCFSQINFKSVKPLGFFVLLLLFEIILSSPFSHSIFSFVLSEANFFEIISFLFLPEK